MFYWSPIFFCSRIVLELVCIRDKSSFRNVAIHLKMINGNLEESDGGKEVALENSAFGR